MPSELVEEEEEAEDTASSQPLENSSDKITKALDDWVANGGFRDSAVTLPMLSKKLKISRSQLTAYFEQQLNSSFRTWLSGIRYKEAQRMLLENSDYSNDTISAECGFSSRTHLYRVFKLNTGLTPLQWREKVSHS
ncbi:MAG TPA: AraC family transcriptional regulator [Prevotella sp.]|nr:AraC family transcriptional regulator [Candidatus Segatella violae]